MPDLIKGGSLANRLIRRGGEMDVHVVGGAQSGGKRARRPWSNWVGTNLLQDCGVGVGAVALATAVSWALQGLLGYVAVSLVYLLGVVVVAMRLNRWAVLLAAALSAVAWDYLFIPPIYTFTIRSPHDVMMFIMFFIVALAMGHTTHQLRAREAAERRARAPGIGAESPAGKRDGERVTRRRPGAGGEGSGRAVSHAHGGVAGHDGGATRRRAAPDQHVFSRRESAGGGGVGVRARAGSGQIHRHAARRAGDVPAAADLEPPVGVLGVLFEERDTWTLDDNDLLETFAAQIAVMITVTARLRRRNRRAWSRNRNGCIIRCWIRCRMN